MPGLTVLEPIGLVMLAVVMAWPGVCSAEDLPRPAFRECLEEAAFRSRMEAALGRGPSLEELEASTMPMTGLLVLSTVPGRWAERFGLQAGEVMIDVNGQQLWDYTADIGDPGVPRTLTVVRPPGEQRRVTAPPGGLLGVWNKDYRRPDLKYIRDGQRDPAYDREVLVAIRTCRTDPDLAETALWHAVQKGYEPDEFSDALGAVIALYQGRPAAAAAIRMRSESGTQTASVWIDGVKDAQSTSGIGPETNTHPWVLGGYWSPTNQQPESVMDGGLGLVAFFDRALTDSEIQSVGVIRDAEGV